MDPTTSPINDNRNTNNLNYTQTEKETKTIPKSENERIAIVRKHYEKKGYRVHSGLQFGCHLVLYTDNPDKVHSDFCVHIVPPNTRFEWRTVQVLVRSMPELHKKLMVVSIRPTPHDRITPHEGNQNYIVDEIMIGTAHAPMRQKNKITVDVGSQFKKQKSKV